MQQDMIVCMLCDTSYITGLPGIVMDASACHSVKGNITSLEDEEASGWCEMGGLPISKLRSMQCIKQWRHACACMAWQTPLSDVKHELSCGQLDTLEPCPWR